jgi:hypothetical protein
MTPAALNQLAARLARVERRAEATDPVREQEAWEAYCAAMQRLYDEDCEYEQRMAVEDERLERIAIQNSRMDISRRQG